MTSADNISKVTYAECSNNGGNDTVSLSENVRDISSTHISVDVNNDEDGTNDSVMTSDSATNDSIDAENKQKNEVLNINEETCSSFLEPPNKKVMQIVEIDSPSYVDANISTNFINIYPKCFHFVGENTK